MTNGPGGGPLFVFDAYGTLLDVHSAVRPRLAELGERGPTLSELWRQKQLEYSWVRTLCDRFVDFDAVTRDALDYAMARLEMRDSELREELLLAYGRLEAYRDVVPALETLQSRGARVAVLSNGTPASLSAGLAAAGIEDHVDAVLSAQTAGRFKTRREVYDLVCSRLAVSRGSVSYQSANRWDIAGAVAFGFRAVWVNRSGAPDEYLDLKPAAEVTSLADLQDLPAPGEPR